MVERYSVARLGIDAIRHLVKDHAVNLARSSQLLNVFAVAVIAASLTAARAIAGLFTVVVAIPAWLWFTR
jgi:hypothetical protein